jgi:hypothetical protein
MEIEKEITESGHGSEETAAEKMSGAGIKRWDREGQRTAAAESPPFATGRRHNPAGTDIDKVRRAAGLEVAADNEEADSRTDVIYVERS